MNKTHTLQDLGCHKTVTLNHNTAADSWNVLCTCTCMCMPWLQTVRHPYIKRLAYSCTNTAISEYEFLSDFRNCPLLLNSCLLYSSIQALCDVY